MFQCGASSRYDLLVDLGGLDGVCNGADADALVTYIETVRGCLRSVSIESALPPLFVHFTSEPEHRSSLLAAAFPTDEQWRVECVALEDDAGLVAANPAASREVYRYTVYRE